MKSQTRYTDKALFILVYPIIAFSFIFIANDNSLYELVRIPSFATDILFALSITYLVGWYLKRVSLKLDRLTSKNNFKERIKLQFIRGFTFPLITSMTLEVVYLHIINIPISESSILNLELPLSILFLLLINIFYLSNYLFYSQKTETATTTEGNTSIAEVIKYITIQKGHREEKVDVRNCAFIKSSKKILWLYTFDNNHFRLNGTLDDWETRLASIFFKINRQYIVAPAAIKSIEQTGIRKLKVHLCLPQEEEVFISKVNATGFKKWWRKDWPS